MNQDNYDKSYADPDAHTYMDVQVNDVHHTRILESVLAQFGCQRGDLVVEIGAGSGRYTQALLDAGLRVLAIEPDEVMANKLSVRLSHYSNFELHVGTANDTSIFPDDVKSICGFHVLHHINKEGLAELGETFSSLILSHQSLHSIFFLEPNPLNPLFPLQIIITPAMSFSEEKWIWRKGVNSMLKIAGRDLDKQSVGLFPPGVITNSVPANLHGLCTQPKPGNSILRSYRLYGWRKTNDAGPNSG